MTTLPRSDHWNLAVLTSFPGAKLGASNARLLATPGHIQPESPQVNGTPGDAGPHPAIARRCMACRRSGVRIPLAPRRYVKVGRRRLITRQHLQQFLGVAS